MVAPIDKIDIWGRRRLAYEINKKSEGIYAVVDFTAESKTTVELDRQLKLSEAVMRTKVLRAEEAIAQVAAHAEGAGGEGRRRRPPPRAKAGAKAAAAAAAPRRRGREGRLVPMAGETIITVVGNLTADPELRYTQNGLAVANFTIASTPRTFDRQANDWKDGEALFLRASVLA